MSASPFGAPLFAARIKATPEDFVVEEIATESATGQGEHLQLWIEKRGHATTDIVQRLCRWANVAPVAIGYAGLKDKQAVTRQRFTVHLPKRVSPPAAAPCPVRWAAGSAGSTRSTRRCGMCRWSPRRRSA